MAKVKLLNVMKALKAPKGDIRMKGRRGRRTLARNIGRK